MSLTELDRAASQCVQGVMNNCDEHHPDYNPQIFPKLVSNDCWAAVRDMYDPREGGVSSEKIRRAIRDVSKIHNCVGSDSRSRSPSPSPSPSPSLRFQPLLLPASATTLDSARTAPFSFAAFTNKFEIPHLAVSSRDQMLMVLFGLGVTAVGAAIVLSSAAVNCSSFGALSVVMTPALLGGLSVMGIGTATTLSFLI